VDRRLEWTQVKCPYRHSACLPVCVRVQDYFDAARVDNMHGFACLQCSRLQ
jgi:hypothetical protein